MVTGIVILFLRILIKESISLLLMRGWGRKIKFGMLELEMWFCNSLTKTLICDWLVGMRPTDRAMRAELLHIDASVPILSASNESKQTSAEG
jgi:hypothetical protein